MVQSFLFESDWIPDGKAEENGSPQGNAQAAEGSGWEVYYHLQNIRVWEPQKWGVTTRN